ncbi:MAG: hypothetical protein V2G42_01940 [bacterium JZ-2024 1]
MTIRKILLILAMIAGFWIPRSASHAKGEIMMRARGIQMGTVLNILASQTDRVLVLDPEVDPSVLVNVDLSGVDLNQALTSILTPHDLYYEISDKVLRIRALDTRSFVLDFIPTDQTAESTVGGNVIGGGARGGGGSAAAGGGGGGAGGTGASLNLRGSFTVETTALNNSIWRQVDTNIRALLSSEGSAVIDSASGTIIVTDRRSRLERVSTYLDSMKRMLRKQVLLEGKIVEVALRKQSQFGIDFQRIFGPSASNPQVTYRQQLAPTVAGGGSISLTTVHSPSDSVLRALQTEGDINTLSSPRLNVLNGQTAIINVGQIQPFVSGISLTVTQTSATTSLEISQAQSGVLFGVTPKISDSGEITLLIVPLVTDIESFRQFTFQGNIVEAPVLNSRATSTIVTVKDGETLVIGGLITTRNDKTIQKTPILGDIPGIGGLFRQTNRTQNKSEVVIVLTPRVIDLDKPS